jgi:hypothetical protein
VVVKVKLSAAWAATGAQTSRKTAASIFIRCLLKVGAMTLPAGPA